MPSHTVGRRMERLGDKGDGPLAPPLSGAGPFTKSLGSDRDAAARSPLTHSMTPNRTDSWTRFPDSEDEDRLTLIHMSSYARRLLAGLSQPRRRRLNAVAKTRTGSTADDANFHAAGCPPFTYAGPGVDSIGLRVI